MIYDSHLSFEKKDKPLAEASGADTKKPYFLMRAPCPFIPLVVKPRYPRPAFETFYGKEISDIGVWK